MLGFISDIYIKNKDMYPVSILDYGIGNVCLCVFSCLRSMERV
jgi:hypothetical protein